MKTPSALWPLVRRPASILPLLYLLFAISLPFLMINGSFGESLDSKSQLLSNVRDVLWINSILSVGGFALVLSFFARTADMKLFAFAVPSLGARVLTEKFIVGFVLALVLSFSLIATGDSRNAPAILGCALLSFAIVSAVTDASTPQRLKGPVSLVLMIAVYKADFVRVALEWAPILTASVSLVIFAILIRKELSANAARARALYQPPIGNTGTGTAFATRDTDTLFSASQAGGISVFDWFRRTDFENFGAKRFGWPRFLVQSVGFSCVFAYLLGDPSFAAMMGLMYLTFQGHRLRGTSLYPLGRSTRADFNFAGSAADSAAYFVSASVAMWLLSKSGLPHPLSSSADLDKRLSILVIPAAMIWAPLVQWLSATSTLPLKKRLRSSVQAVRSLVHALVTFLLTVLTARGGVRLAASTSTGVALGLSVVLALLVQTGYWLALRRHFSKKDLV